MDAAVAEWATRFASLGHCVVSLALAAYLTFLALGEAADEEGNPMRLGLPSATVHTMTFSFSLAYFTIDLVIAIYYGLMDRPMIFHHLGAMLGLAYGCFAQVSGRELLFAMALLEVSNPFLHVRWMLRELDLKTTTVYKVNELAFFAVFVLIRVGAGTWLWYYVVRSAAVDLFVKTSATALWAVSCLWLLMILRVFAAKYIMGKSHKGEKQG